MKQLFFILALFFSANMAIAGHCSQENSLGDTLIFPIHAPTVFTPNYDGVNDIFRFNTSGAKKVSCTIYNRWGVKVFEWEGVDGFWDGRTSAGLACPIGVYYYVVLITDPSGIVHEENGFTHLLR